eukprot:scaffold2904_cov118-Isochrysis_galbana.AAC.1
MPASYEKAGTMRVRRTDHHLAAQSEWAGLTNVVVEVVPADILCDHVLGPEAQEGLGLRGGNVEGSLAEREADGLRGGEGRGG